MSFKFELEEALVDLDYSDLKIDKDFNYKGRNAVKVEFLLDGNIVFETVVTDDLGLNSVDKAALVATNARKALENYRGEAK